MSSACFIPHIGPFRFWKSGQHRAPVCFPDIFTVVRSRWVPETAPVPSAFHPVSAGILEFPVSHQGSSVKAPPGDLSPSVRRQSPVHTGNLKATPPIPVTYSCWNSSTIITWCSSDPPFLHRFSSDMMLMVSFSFSDLFSGGKCFLHLSVNFPASLQCSQLYQFIFMLFCLLQREFKSAVKGLVYRKYRKSGSFSKYNQSLCIVKAYCTCISACEHFLHPPFPPLATKIEKKSEPSTS